MVFTETTIPSGEILYKGYRHIGCRTLLKDARTFFLTQSVDTAKNYGTPCSYRVKKTLRLFDLTHHNLNLLLTSKYPLTDETRAALRLVTGVGVTAAQQKTMLGRLLGQKEINKLPSVGNKPGGRASYKELNKLAFGNLSKEFLTREGYDGYYSAKQNSAFHKGEFPSEIMLVNAYRHIEKYTKSGQLLPVVDVHSIKLALPRIFMEFSKGTTRLTRPYGKGLVIFCTGGMAVRTYLQARKAYLPPKLRRTSDFDFTFAIPKAVRQPLELSSYVISMRRIMTNHMNAFIRYLNREYSGCNARLNITRRVKSPFNNPRMQVPATNRRIYQVVTYDVILGNGEKVGLVDTALAVYPGASRSMLHLPLSYKLGIPIQRLRYQLKDSLALLTGSFLYKGLISHRNPLTGKTKNKGAKNVARTEGLIRIARRNNSLRKVSNETAPLINRIKNRNIKGSRQRARRVEKLLKQIK
jgi:hypothetical protein